MGTFGPEPWSDDDAADWLAETMEASGLRDRVLAALRDPSTRPAQARGAIGLFLLLGQPMIWPIEAYEADCAEIAAALRRLIDDDHFSGSPELVETMRGELALIERRAVPAADRDEAEEDWDLPWWKRFC